MKHDHNYFLQAKFILIQCRNWKTMWLIISDTDTVLMSDDNSFSTEPLLSIIKILSSASEKGNNFLSIPD